MTPNTPNIVNVQDNNAFGNVLLCTLHVYKHPKVNINSFTCPFQCRMSATWQHKLNKNAFQLRLHLDLRPQNTHPHPHRLELPMENFRQFDSVQTTLCTEKLPSGYTQSVPQKTNTVTSIRSQKADFFDSNVKKFGYNEHSLERSFFPIYQCRRVGNRQGLI